MAMRVVLVLAALAAVLVAADEVTHKYKHGEEVTLWVNKIGPYHNPQETYAYDSLPWCKPTTEKRIRHKSDGLGAILEGNDLKDSGIHIPFLESIPTTTLCQLTLTKKSARVFEEAIQNHYWYQMYVDELPVWGMLGQMMQREGDAGAETAYIYTHKAFSISYNKDQIIEINLTSDNPRLVRAGETIDLTYSVQWKTTDKAFVDRFDRYLDFDFFEHQIHGFSIFNSFMMVLFLCGLVILILMRTVRNDFARYAQEDEELELDRVIDESGWKMVHSDVFRAPRYLKLFAALVGTGYQLAVLALACILLAIAGSLYSGRGAMMSTLVVVHSLTSLLAGYASGSYYKRNGGTGWKPVLFLTAVIYPGTCFATVFCLNVVAVAYQSLAAISVGTMMIMVAIWLFVSVPLVFLGTLIGRAGATVGDHPCRVNKIARPIPRGQWYTQPWLLSLAGGVLPFGSIYIEIYFVFSSFWHYKVYYVYGFMLLVFCILVIVVICVNVVSTYVLLNAEDHRWQWTSFYTGGSTALYVFVYSVYYFYAKTHMYGLFQTCFYFGYVTLGCLGIFILCGSVGFYGSNLFVHRVYQYIKSD